MNNNLFGNYPFRVGRGGPATSSYGGFNQQQFQPNGQHAVLGDKSGATKLFGPKIFGISNLNSNLSNQSII